MAHVDFDSAFENIFSSRPKDDSVKADITFTGNASPIDDLFVDMGLSVKWAKWNIGAESPEDIGDFFAWGETKIKKCYNWDNYKWGTKDNLLAYNDIDGRIILDAQDDVAYLQSGGKWRLPQKEECQELHEECLWAWTERNGINGYLITSKKKGYTNKSIFLPATGFRDGMSIYNNSTQGCHYWSSSRVQKLEMTASILSNEPILNGAMYRYFGLPVRPVCE